MRKEKLKETVGEIFYGSLLVIFGIALGFILSLYLSDSSPREKKATIENFKLGMMVQQRIEIWKMFFEETEDEETLEKLESIQDDLLNADSIEEIENLQEKIGKVVEEFQENEDENFLE